jgi:cobalt/nickel transport system permease protein
MHISQEMLNGTVCSVTTIISAVVVGASVYFAVKSKKKPDAGKFFKVMALIFVMQMLNFPIQSGTSGHFLGGTFAAAMLGTPFAVAAMSIVLTIQTLLFGDGGVNALGANILNIAIIGTMIPGIILNYFKSKNSIRKYGITALTAYLAVVIASLACAVEVGVSGIFPVMEGIKSMVTVHMAIGAVEGVITAILCIAAAKGALRTREYIITTLLLIATTPFASANPDGLEWVVEKIGIIRDSVGLYQPIFNDYSIAVIESSYISTFVSAIAGIFVCGIVTVIIYSKKNKI